MSCDRTCMIMNAVLIAILFVGILNHTVIYNAVPIHNISESGTDQQYLTKNIIPILQRK